MARDLTTDPTDEHATDGFVEYLEHHLTKRNWTVNQFCEHAGLAPSVVFRWKRGFRPHIGNSRLMAQALRVPLLEVLVKAGVLTADEASAHVEIRPVLSDIPTDALLREVSVRMQEQDVELRRLRGETTSPTADHD